MVVLFFTTAVIDAECVCCENVVLRKFPSFSRNELNEKAHRMNTVAASN